MNLRQIRKSENLIGNDQVRLRQQQLVNKKQTNVDLH